MSDVTIFVLHKADAPTFERIAFNLSKFRERILRNKINEPAKPILLARDCIKHASILPSFEGH